MPQVSGRFHRHAHIRIIGDARDPLLAVSGAVDIDSAARLELDCANPFKIGLTVQRSVARETCAWRNRAGADRGGTGPGWREDKNYIRLAISSSITSVAPPPIDWMRASRNMRSIAAPRKYP